MNQKDNFNLCIVTSPRSDAGIYPLSNLVSLALGLSTKLFLVTGNEGKTLFDKFPRLNGYSVTYAEEKNSFSRIIAYLKLQIDISYQLLKMGDKVDVFIFYMGEGLFLPIIVLKILRKKVILFLASSFPNILRNRGNKNFFSESLRAFELLNYSLCNNIIIYSSNLISEWKLEKYNSKILIAHEHFLDLDIFNIKNKYYDRKYSVGYIGRFSEEKGVLNLIRSIPSLLEKNPNLSFFIAGSGELGPEIENYLESKCLMSNVIFRDWVPHDELPDYLNDLKLLILPSYTEGLPNIMLESMACGTPVLVTAVGAIPDIVLDCETGFILKNNSPEFITKNIEKALNYPEIDKIIINARNKLITNFNFDASKNSLKKTFQLL